LSDYEPILAAMALAHMRRMPTMQRPWMRIYTGAMPETCEAEPTGELIAAYPMKPITDASYDNLRWEAYISAALGPQVASGYFRVLDSEGVCHSQGTFDPTLQTSPPRGTEP
jgi:hypothetical protein